MFKIFTDQDEPLILCPEVVFEDDIIGFHHLTCYPMQVVAVGTKFIFKEDDFSPIAKQRCEEDQRRKNGEYVHFLPYPMLQCSLDAKLVMNPLGRGAVWTLIKIDQWLNDFTTVQFLDAAPATSVYFYPELLNIDLPHRKWGGNVVS